MEASTHDKRYKPNGRPAASSTEQDAGTELKDLVQHPQVAVQVEQFQDGRWFSVVLKGTAIRLAVDQDIERSGVLDLVPTQPGDKFNYVRVIPDAITGRTFIAR